MKYYIWKNGSPTLVSEKEWLLGIIDPEPVRPTAEVPSNMHVAYTVLRTKGKHPTVMVSTVFLGADRRTSIRPNENNDPILFETMMFWYGNDELDCKTERYSTLEEAEQGHDRMVEFAKTVLMKQSE